MSAIYSSYGESLPRLQAERIAEMFLHEGVGFHGALLAKRREGKTDLLRQVYARLFEHAEGLIPVSYTFQPARGDDALARHFCATFCMQVRGFLMRQEEVLGAASVSLERELEKAGLPLAL